MRTRKLVSQPSLIVKLDQLTKDVSHLINVILHTERNYKDNYPFQNPRGKRNFRYRASIIQCIDFPLGKSKQRERREILRQCAASICPCNYFTPLDLLPCEAARDRLRHVCYSCFRLVLAVQSGPEPIPLPTAHTVEFAGVNFMSGRCESLWMYIYGLS